MDPVKAAELRRLLSEIQDMYDMFTGNIARTDKELQQRGIAYKATKPQTSEMSLDELLNNVSTTLKKNGGHSL